MSDKRTLKYPTTEEDFQQLRKLSSTVYPNYLSFKNCSQGYCFFYNGYSYKTDHPYIMTSIQGENSDFPTQVSIPNSPIRYKIKPRIIHPYGFCLFLLFSREKIEGYNLNQNGVFQSLGINRYFDRDSVKVLTLTEDVFCIYDIGKFVKTYGITFTYYRNGSPDPFNQVSFPGRFYRVIRGQKRLILVGYTKFYYIDHNMTKVSVFNNPYGDSELSIDHFDRIVVKGSCVGEYHILDNKLGWIKKYEIIKCFPAKDSRLNNTFNVVSIIEHLPHLMMIRKIHLESPESVPIPIMRIIMMYYLCSVFPQSNEVLLEIILGFLEKQDWVPGSLTSALIRF